MATLQLIPGPDDRAWIIRHLADLVAERGFEPFLGWPIRRPTSADFPDVWRGDHASVKTLLRRILNYAGLRELSIELDFFTDGEEDLGLNLDCNGVHHPREVAAWFAGIDDDGTAHFGVEREQLRDTESLVGVLCHEVAHAYRARFGLTYYDADDDEIQTDLTTVFLSFGMLTANLTDKYKRRGDPFARSQSGYMSMGAMSFALGVQLVARDTSAKEVKAIARMLEPGQEAAVLESYGLLWPDRSTLLAKLSHKTRQRRPNEGQPVFRIRGGWFRKPRCSGVDCNSELSKTDTVCSKCGGLIQKDVGSRAEATQVEKDLAAAMGAKILGRLTTPDAAQPRSRKDKSRP